MNVVERFLKYVSYPTSSGPDREGRASTDGQYVLAEELMKELLELGVTDVRMNQYGIVSGIFKGTLEPTIALLAHMDTSPSASGENIKPRIIENYDGSDIELAKGITMRTEEFTTLKKQVGDDLIVTDGTTLLGGDDKAGIAIIMDALQRLRDSKEPHHTIEVIFTTDEEIGTGVHHVDSAALRAEYGYTVDGGSSHFINKANFNAANMEVAVRGRSVHPGSAKHKMINAIEIAIEFDRSLPAFERPEYTEQREGFFHLNEIRGNEELTQMSYIIRDFDEVLLKHRKWLIGQTAGEINRRLGYEAITYKIDDVYQNMEPILEKTPAVVDRIMAAYEALNIPYQFEDIRGGTDGSQLTYRNLPCPNLGTGDYNCHGRFEYVDINEMKQMVDVVCKMMTLR